MNMRAGSPSTSSPARTGPSSTRPGRSSEPREQTPECRPRNRRRSRGTLGRARRVSRARWRWTAGGTRATSSSVVGGGQRLDPDDVAAASRRRPAARPRPGRAAGRTGPAIAATRPEQRRADELAQHRRALLAGHRRAQHAEDRRPEPRLLPDAQEQPHQALAEHRPDRRRAPPGSARPGRTAAPSPRRRPAPWCRSSGAPAPGRRPAVRAMPRTLAPAYPRSRELLAGGVEDRRTPVAAVGRPARVRAAPRPVTADRPSRRHCAGVRGRCAGGW